ncbi:pullulanase [Mycolicibacterium sp. 018/SC-01/001]|uniref:pullulanase n=1 Tax=Mycolicibacterium sp. 018/SC-01/001 TaxID=2592069 RepID=UPI00117ECA17|nr:pullulanase [Mycolicibacterium sp. 018/SC-01/001]TRW89215.1 pullulanase [Mycolicibacterium sp. 018/SC-01/001]
MEYCLGDLAGGATMWSADPTTDIDGDGVLDGVLLDLDHDGLVDDALADLDADGLAERGVLGVGGAAAVDVGDDGTGTWAVPLDRGTALRWLGLDGVEHPAGSATVDLDGDGQADEQLVDTDGDGLADRAFGTGTAWVDTDRDGRWDVRLVDGDGDGTADSATPL